MNGVKKEMANSETLQRYEWFKKFFWIGTIIEFSKFIFWRSFWCSFLAGFFDVHFRRSFKSLENVPRIEFPEVRSKGQFLQARVRLIRIWRRTKQTERQKTIKNDFNLIFKFFMVVIAGSEDKTKLLDEFFLWPSFHSFI